MNNKPAKKIRKMFKVKGVNINSVEGKRLYRKVKKGNGI